MFLCPVNTISGLGNQSKLQMLYVKPSEITLYAFGKVTFFPLLLFFIFFFQYERDGYLAVKNIFNEDEKKELIEAMDELIEM